MNLIENKLSFILGQKVFITEDISVKQFTIREIQNMSYFKYLNKVGFVIRSVDEILELLSDTEFYMDLFLEKHNLNEFKLQTFLCNDLSYKKEFESSLAFLLGVKKEQIEVENDRILYKLSNNDIKLVDEQTFQEILNVVKIANGYDSAKELDDKNPFSKKTEAVLEKMKKNREKVAKAKAGKKDKNDKRDLADVISAVTAKSNSINKFNVLDLTLYQLYDENSRLYTIENYHLSVKASMFGGDGDVTDWGQPL